LRDTDIKLSVCLSVSVCPLQIGGLLKLNDWQMMRFSRDYSRASSYINNYVYLSVCLSVCLSETWNDIFGSPSFQGLAIFECETYENRDAVIDDLYRS